MSGPESVHRRIGQLVAGRYELLTMIGSGGQGAVFRARDRRDGDHCAIKILSDELARDPDFRERMFREARAMVLLGGTAAVRVLDQVWTDDGALCLVMELLHGKDLEDLLADLERAGQAVPPGALLSLLEPIAQTLHVAHHHGIVHRDLKPANIYCIDPEHGGGVRLLDFGFAKFQRARSFTAVDHIAGSPHYIAPETWRGRGVDARSDIYSFSAVVFRALAGRPPFQHKLLGELLQLVTRGPRPSLHALRPDLPPRIDDWVAQALAVEPSERFLHIQACWNALRGSLGG